MIRAHYRFRDGTARLAATGPGLPGPLGVWPADLDDEEHELVIDCMRETNN